MNWKLLRILMIEQFQLGNAVPAFYPGYLKFTVMRVWKSRAAPFGA